MVLGDTIKTPRGSHIRSLYPDSLDLAGPPKAQIENFKRRLQYKGGVRSNVLNTDGYKDFHRQEKLNHFREDQRSKRDAALSKSRGCNSFLLLLLLLLLNANVLFEACAFADRFFVS